MRLFRLGINNLALANFNYKLFDYSIKHNISKFALKMSTVSAENWKLIKTDLDENVSKRSSHSLNFINNKLFIFGGEHLPRVPIDNKFVTYDLNDKKWSVLEAVNQNEAPTPRVGHSSCVLDNRLYVFGGRTGADMGENSLNDLYLFDPASNKWTLLDDGSSDISPEKRSFHSMASAGNKIYIFGGCSVNHGRLNDLYEYDVERRVWVKLESLSEIVGRGGAGFCGHSSQNESSDPSCLYVIGGFCGHELDDVYKYEISSKKWSKIESLPRKLSVFAVSSTTKNDKKIVLHGGEIDPSTLGHNGAGEFSSDTYVFDGSKWSLLNFELKPSTRGWHTSCYDSINNVFYIYGGNLENNLRSDELWSLKI